MKKIVTFKVLILVIETVYVVQGAITLNNRSKSFNNNYDTSENSVDIDDDYYSNLSFDDDFSDNRFNIDFSQEQQYMKPPLNDEELRKVAQFQQLLKSLSIEKMVSGVASKSIPYNVANKVKRFLENASEIAANNGSWLNEPIASFMYMIENPQYMKNLDEAYKQEAALSNKDYNPEDGYVTVDKFLSAVRKNWGLPENQHLFDDLDEGFDDDLKPDSSYPTVVQEQLLKINELEKLAEYLPLAYSVYGAAVDTPDDFRLNLLDKLNLIKQRLQTLGSPLINAVNFQIFTLSHPELMKKIVRALAEYDEKILVNLTVGEFFDILRLHTKASTQNLAQSLAQNSAQNSTQNSVTQKPTRNSSKITNPYQHVPPLIGVMNAVPSAATVNVNVDALTNGTTQAKGATGVTNRFSLSGNSKADIDTTLGNKSSLTRTGEKWKNEYDNTTAAPQKGIETKPISGLGTRRPSIDGEKTSQEQQQTKKRKQEQSNRITKRKKPTQTMKSGPNATGSSPSDTGTAETNLEEFQSNEQPSSGNDSKEKMDSLTRFGTNGLSILGKSSGPL